MESGKITAIAVSCFSPQRDMPFSHHYLLGSLLVLLAGCSSVGPPSVSKDRFDYNTAVSGSWKEQTLLNIVKLRYADMPLFMDVASIVAGYSLESSVNLTGTLVEGSAAPGTLALGGTGQFTDRPTITYVPITGSQFNRSYLTPIPPSALLFLIQAGWPAEVFLPVTLEAINGMRATKSLGVGERRGHDDFYQVIALLAKIQKAGGLGMRILTTSPSEETTVLVIRRSDLPPDVAASSTKLSQLLGIDPNVSEYQVAFGEVARNRREIAILTRSTISIMYELAGQIDVPSEHVAEGRTLPSRDAMGSASDLARLIHVQHAKERPVDAFVAVRYRDLWFWISDRDYRSKRTLAYLMLLFSLTESGGKESLPLVTIPAG